MTTIVTPSLARIIIMNSIIYTSATSGTVNNWPDDEKLYRFTNLMRSGKWVSKGSLYINANGGVQDGHHRILAVFLSGTNQAFAFKFDVDHLSLNGRYLQKYPALWETVSKNIDKGIFTNVKKGIV